MTGAEEIRLYADLLWWWLVLLAAGGIPICVAGIAAMILRMRLMEDLYYRPPPVPPPPFPSRERWEELGRPTSEEWIRMTGPAFVTITADSWGRWRWLCRRTKTPKTAPELIFQGARWLAPVSGK